MEDLTDTLEQIESSLASVGASTLSGTPLDGSTDEELVAVLAAAAQIRRHAEALLVEGAAQVDARAGVEVPRDDRVTTRFGCRNAAELIQRVTRVSSRSAFDFLKAGRAIVREVAPSSGELLPPEFPAVRAAVAAGHIGVDGILAVAGQLAGVVTAAGRAAQLAADEELAAAARGDGADGAPPATVDELRTLATVWAMYFDQDGAEPRETRAARKRALTLGVCRDGLVSLRGNLLPEVAAQLQRAFDSLLNPKLDGVPVPAATGPVFAPLDESDPDSPYPAAAETRTRVQQQHDAFASVLAGVAASGSLPTLGGSAPTLVVSVREEDILSGRGFAHISGIDEPVSLATARHIACTGAIQRIVLDDTGRIVSLGSPDRVFNANQRRAIALRDGGCLIPGCHVPAEWCELHHVEEHARGGPTHTDNGVMLCWHHHRTLDTSGWKIRMTHGVPEVQGPSWWDTRRRWRQATTSPTTMRERVVRRT